MARRKSNVVLAVLTGLVIAVAASVIHATMAQQQARVKMEANRSLVRDLGLSDLCLFTEARYTRHLSQADLHSAFQDHPISIEHFPSGALVAPPQLIAKAYENLDRKTKAPD